MKAFPFMFIVVLIIGLGAATVSADNSVKGWTIVSQMQLPQAAALAVFADESFGIASGHSGDTYTSSDAGENWSAAPTSGLCCYGIDIVNENIAWAVGNNGGVFLSTDSGQSWGAVHDLPDNDHISSMVSFADDQAGWVSNAQAVYSTTDGGQSWEEIPMPEGYTWGNPVIALALYAAGSGYLMDGQGNFYSTTDGGATWTVQKITLSDNRSLSVMVPPVIRFSDENNGLIAFRIKKAGFAVLRTADGGASWTEEALPFEGGNGMLAISHDGSYITYLDGENLFVAHYDEN